MVILSSHCRKNRQSHFLLPGVQLVVSLFGLHVTFIVGETLLMFSTVCVVFAALLQFLLLSTSVWLLVVCLTLLLAARNSSKMMGFKIVSTIAGWGELLTAVGVD